MSLERSVRKGEAVGVDGARGGCGYGRGGIGGGVWVKGDDGEVVSDVGGVRSVIGDVGRGVCVVEVDGGYGVAVGGELSLALGGEEVKGRRVVGYVGPMVIGELGDGGFRDDYGLKYAYMGGAVANGISSVDMVIAMSKGGMLCSYGAGGQTTGQIDEAIGRVQSACGDGAYCFNLIHSPGEPGHEMAVAELYLKRGVRVVEASAFLGLTLAVVKYAVSGLRRGARGEVVRENRVIAKVSRVEVARKWLSSAPEKMLRELVGRGDITEEQAKMASEVAVASDLTAEADSGGHTDNRSALTLLPTMLKLRDSMARELGYKEDVRVGLGGGIGTGWSAAGAFAMGAEYVVTGSVNQGCIESGSCDRVREMLAGVGQGDVTMAPSADMFEMGVKLQVIKRGTMFAMRAGKLYELYRKYDSIEAIEAKERVGIEKTIFRAGLDEVWEETKRFFGAREQGEVARAEMDGKHKMALVFRWYLGLASRWANAGDESRVMDYQIWCGPAMGAFNEWVKNTEMEKASGRDVVGVGLNILYGAAVVLRAGVLRGQGVKFGAGVVDFNVRSRGEIEGMIK